MRKIYLLAVSVAALLFTTGANAQEAGDSTDLPGDNFSLAGALTMFKKAASPEAFEQLLNTQENGVNNLDLNADGNTDYIRVINKRDKDVNIFILQAQLSATESQDVAVIELERTGEENAVIQIVGDEDIYGDTTIVEPTGSLAGSQRARQFPSHGPHVVFDYVPASIGIVINVWTWPCVRFVYAPAYRPWISPWAWRRYPVWWRPWRPLAWVAYRPVRVKYYPACTVVHTRRIVAAPVIYRPVRVTSVTVINRYRAPVANYRATRTVRTTTVTGPRGRQYHSARSTTVVRGPAGNRHVRVRHARKAERVF
jgi:hypothetical protein